MTGVLFWEVIRINQYALSVGSLWNMWSHNLTNVFIAPVTAPEYFAAYMFIAATEASLMFCLLVGVERLLFGFNILQVGLPLILASLVNCTIFAWTIGLVMIGLIFRFGTRIQALAWGIIFIFEPLTAAFFPVKVLPPVLQKIAWVFPPTYLFENLRAALNGNSINWPSIFFATILNLIYFGISALVFSAFFHKSKESGQFARMDG